MIRIIILLVSLMFALPAYSKNIYMDPGGDIAQRYLGVLKLKKSGEQVRILGTCASACTMYFALPKNQLCIGKHGKLIFHQASLNGKRSELGTTFMFNTYPHWVRQWIQNRGGLTSKLLVIPAKYAQKYMRSC